MERNILRVAILQRVCPPYRIPLFRRLSSTCGIELQLFVGADVPNTKVKSAEVIDGINVRKLKTHFLQIGDRTIVVHRRLLLALKQYAPDVVICEGESHIVGCFIGLLYRTMRPSTGVVHWSLGAVPGGDAPWYSLRAVCRRWFRRQFDAFVVYSSFGRGVLIKEQIPAERIFVAVNVADTQEHILQFTRGEFSKTIARERLGLRDKFTAIYVGSIERDKRLEVLIRASVLVGVNRVNVVIVGDGDCVEELKDLAKEIGATSVAFVGRVVEGLATYYRCSDALVLPGRGGIVISEAMAYGLPVIAFEADGTEYDLVQDALTGVRLRRGDAEELAAVLDAVIRDANVCQAMGQRAQEMVGKYFTQEAMAKNIIQAAHSAQQARRKR